MGSIYLILYIIFFICFPEKQITVNPVLPAGAAGGGRQAPGWPEYPDIPAAAPDRAAAADSRRPARICLYGVTQLSITSSSSPPTEVMFRWKASMV